MDRLAAKRNQIRHACEHLGENDELLVSQVMTSTPRCIAPETRALELVRLFHTNEFRHLLVKSPRGELLGVVSDRDVLRYLGPDRPNKDMLESVPASKVMSSDVITVNPRMPLRQAVSIMITHGISSLPVLADGLLVGIITNTDLQVALQLLLATPQSASGSDGTSVRIDQLTASNE